MYRWMEEQLVPAGTSTPFSELPAWKSLVREPPRGAHILQIYEDPEREAEAASLFVHEGLRKGERVCCVGNARELKEIRRRLDRDGVDVARLVEARALVQVERLDLNGGPTPPEETSPEALDRFLQEVFREVPDRYPGVRWWGNRIAQYFENGFFDRCMAFEELCHERRNTLRWSLLCAYDARKLDSERHAAAFWDLLRTHSHLIPAGELGVALELFPRGVHE